MPALQIITGPVSSLIAWWSRYRQLLKRGDAVLAELRKAGQREYGAWIGSGTTPWGAAREIYAAVSSPDVRRLFAEAWACVPMLLLIVVAVIRTVCSVLNVVTVLADQTALDHLTQSATSAVGSALSSPEATDKRGVLDDAAELSWQAVISSWLPRLTRLLTGGSAAAAGATGSSSEQASPMWRALALAASIRLAMHILYQLCFLLERSIEARCATAFSCRLYAAALRSDVTALEAQEARSAAAGTRSTALGRLESDIRGGGHKLAEAILIPVRALDSLTTVVGSGIAMFRIDVRLSLFYCALRLPVLLNAAGLAQSLADRHDALKRDLATRVETARKEALSNVRLLQVHTAEGSEAARLEALYADLKSAEQDMHVVDTAVNYVATLLYRLISVGTNACAAYRVLQGALAATQIRSFVVLSDDAADTLDRLLGYAGEARKLAALTVEPFAVLDRAAAGDVERAAAEQRAREALAREEKAADHHDDGASPATAASAATGVAGLRRRHSAAALEPASSGAGAMPAPPPLHADGASASPAAASAVDGAASPAVALPSQARPVIRRMDGDVAVRDVWFAYPARRTDPNAGADEAPSATGAASAGAGAGAASASVSGSATASAAKTASGAASAASAAPGSKDAALTAPDGSPYVLKGMSCVFPAGKFTALVGSSGAGKTSILRLILGLYSPSPPPASAAGAAAGAGAGGASAAVPAAAAAAMPGEVSIDSVPVDQWTAYDLRRQIAYIDQEATLLNRSIRENLLLGLLPEERPSDAEIERACRGAAIWDSIVAWDGGLDAMVGPRGVKLSSGERQRIAIARAFLRDPAVVLADEITANLDAISELKVKEGLRELVKGRTVIMIAHRLSMAMGVDHVVVCEGGRVVEEGAPATLLASPASRFSELVAAQTLDRDEMAALAASTRAERKAAEAVDRDARKAKRRM